MEDIGVIVMGILIALVVLPIVALVKAGVAKRVTEEMEQRIRILENEMRSLRVGKVSGGKATPEQQRPVAAAEVKAAGPMLSPPLTSGANVTIPNEQEEYDTANPAAPKSAPTQLVNRTEVEAAGVHSSQPPPLQSIPKVKQPVAPVPPSKPPVNWEQFMGAKLFAWVGGVALFFGVAFFIKFSFEHNLIPPEARAAIGFLVGLALLAGGVIMKRKETAVTAQTLCSTGVLILYGVTFACRAFYHFPFFGAVPTFLLMTLITAVAFLLAAGTDAMVVSILGIAGGFLTPVLLSTGQDAPLALFGYIGLLDIGLLAVAMRKRWNVLPMLGAIGTALTQIGWCETFFEAGSYFKGNKVFIAMAVFAGFEFLFLAVVAWEKTRKRGEHTFSIATLLPATVSMFAAFYFLSFSTLGQRPALLFIYLFAVDFGLLALVVMDEALSVVAGVAGGVAFTFLACWTQLFLGAKNLYPALAFYFVFAVFHSAAPVVISRLQKKTPAWWSNAFPALALLLVLLPILKLEELSLLIWPLVLLINLLAVILAVATSALLPVLVVLILTLLASGAWISRIPATMTGLPESLFMIGGFAVFFIVAASFACRRMLSKSAASEKSNLFGNFNNPANLAVQIPALSAVLPFLLLIMVTLRLPLSNPSPVFGIALLLVILILGLGKIMTLQSLPVVGLLSVVALEHIWHLHRFNHAQPASALAWYPIFYSVFTVFPFLFHRQFAKTAIPWATAAIAGPLHFYLLHQLVRSAYPGFSGMMGLLPAAFSVPALIGVVVLLNRTPAASPARDSQFAWFGGVALFFITLIFPIQFERQWITIGWALEGAALCWLFRRVPHRGLRLTGAGLLVAAFVRLALNPAVLSYHARTATPVFNWYFYAYGITAASLFVAARLLAPPRNSVLGFNSPPIFCGLGTVLGFLLVNIEITDYFTKAGTVALTFEFGGDFARDMSYSIAWALFALLLLVIGIRKRLAPVRYASIGLLGVTLLKLFLHDLSQLDQLYRIAAFIVVAVIAMLASFLYQRFLSPVEKNETKTHPAPLP